MVGEQLQTRGRIDRTSVPPICGTGNGITSNGCAASKCRPLRHDNTVSDCAVSPDGTQIVTLDYSGHVHWWEATTGREIRPPVRGHESAAGVTCDVMFSPDGSHLATSGWDDVKVWDASSGEQLHAWKPPAREENAMGFRGSPTARTASCWRASAHRLGAKEVTRVWDPVDGQRTVRTSSFLGSRVLDMAVSPDNRLLALACEDSTVWLVDAEHGKGQTNVARRSIVLVRLVQSRRAACRRRDRRVKGSKTAARFGFGTSSRAASDRP